MAFLSFAVVLALVAVATANKEYVKLSLRSLNDDESGHVLLEVDPALAPLGAARFLELVHVDFFKGVRFFRNVPNFVTQFGISGNPAVSAKWRKAKLQDDPVVGSNTKKTLSFASAGPDTRTTQLFINLVDNTRLDGMGFAPFATVVGGWQNVEQIYMGDGEEPSQARIQSEGNHYLEAAFPKLSYIHSAELVSPQEAESLRD